MFNLQHILYMVISAIVSAGLLVLFAKTVKEQKHKNFILKFFAVITVVIHISNLWVEFFQNGGTAQIVGVHILPLFPCNIVMWMLLVTAFIDNKEGTVFRLLAEFCFIVGTLCGVVGILLNQNFGANPTLADYGILKGMLSHSTMLIGCIYLFVGGYVRPGIFSTLSLVFGFGIFVICGIVTNVLYAAFGMTSPDGIWINGVPYIGVSSIILGLALVAVYFGVFALIELRLPPEKRWYSRLKNWFVNLKNKGEKQ
ncbi:MAG: YwaF family protein [Clostridia bacterium]|nr:YwaF family protein [Clostridia bacterium]